MLQCTHGGVRNKCMTHARGDCPNQGSRLWSRSIATPVPSTPCAAQLDAPCWHGLRGTLLPPTRGYRRSSAEPSTPSSPARNVFILADQSARYLRAMPSPGPCPCRLDPPTPPSAALNCAASRVANRMGVCCAAPQLPQCCRPGCMVARCIVGCAVHCRLHRRLRAHASCPPVAISRLKSVVRWSAACHGTLPVALLPASRELRCERAVMRVASSSRTAHTLYRATPADD
jgi:hypothetical protein